MPNFGWLVPRKVRESGRSLQIQFVSQGKNLRNIDSWFNMIEKSKNFWPLYQLISQFLVITVFCSYHALRERGRADRQRARNVEKFVATSSQSLQSKSQENIATPTNRQRPNPMKVSNWKRWLSSIQPTNLFWLSILKVVSFGENLRKKSSKDGK